MYFAINFFQIHCSKIWIHCQNEVHLIIKNNCIFMLWDKNVGNQSNWWLMSNPIFLQWPILIQLSFLTKIHLYLFSDCVQQYLGVRTDTEGQDHMMLEMGDLICLRKMFRFLPSWNFRTKTISVQFQILLQILRYFDFTCLSLHSPLQNIQKYYWELQN